MAVIDQVEARAALRKFHAHAPEAASTVEAYLDHLIEVNMQLTNEDAYRAFVLQMAQSQGSLLALLQRLDSTVLSDLSRAEAARAEADLIAAQSRRDGHATLRHTLTQPVVMALMGLLSTVVSGAVGLAWWLLGAEPPQLPPLP